MATLLADWNNTLGMVHRMIHNPAILKKFAPYIKPEFIYYGESDLRVRGLRTLFKVLLDLNHEGRVKDILGDGSQTAIYPFLAELRKLPDGEVKDEALKIADRIKSDKEIAFISESDGCLNQFLDYLKAITIRDWSSEFAEPYRQGKILPATNLLKDLIVKLEKINVRSFETLVADDLYDSFGSKQIGVNNFKLGIKPLDGEWGFCEPATLTIFMAPPAGGKSMMSTTIIANAVLQRRYVNWTVVEDRRRTFEPRLMAALTGIPIYRLKNEFTDLTSQEIVRFNKAVKMIKEYVHVDYIYGEDIEMIHERKIEVDQQRRATGKPEYDIDGVDYTMHVAATSGGNSDKMHEKLMQAYAHRKNYCLTYKKTAFDFLQVNRSGATKTKGGAEFLEMTDIAGAFDIARVGDNIISINRSTYDKDNNHARFWVAKGRDGSPDKPVIVPTDFKYGRYNVAGAFFPEEEQPVVDEKDDPILTMMREID
jgi:hypothetical protein